MRCCDTPSPLELIQVGVRCLSTGGINDEEYPENWQTITSENCGQREALSVCEVSQTQPQGSQDSRTVVLRALSPAGGGAFRAMSDRNSNARLAARMAVMPWLS